MKTKHYTALFAFVATFAISATVAGFFKIEQGAFVLWDETKTAQKITELLSKDIANGRERILNEDYAITTLSYVDNSESLDDSNLPSDFRQAWRAHMKAWRSHSDFLNNTPRYVEVSAHRTANEYRTANESSRRVRKLFSQNVNEINRTWSKVLKIAEKHGAEIPAGAYQY